MKRNTEWNGEKSETIFTLRWVSLIFMCMSTELIDYYLAGNDVAETTKKFGVSRRTLYRVLKTNNVDTSSRPRKVRQPKNDLTGHRFSHLTVQRMQRTKRSTDGTWRCVCRCDCGQENDYPPSILRRGMAKTCGKSSCPFHRQDYSNNGKNNVRFTGYEEILGSKWKAYECGANRRGIEFSIDIKYVWELFLKQNRRCALTGEEIGFGRTYKKGSTASLDRIDSSKGYVRDNVQWVHKDVNALKRDFPEKRLFELCQKIVNHKKLSGHIP